MNTLTMTAEYRRDLLTEWLKCRRHIRLCHKYGKVSYEALNIAARRRERMRHIESMFSRKAA